MNIHPEQRMEDVDVFQLSEDEQQQLIREIQQSHSRGNHLQAATHYRPAVPEAFDLHFAFPVPTAVRCSSTERAEITLVQRY